MRILLPSDKSSGTTWKSFAIGLLISWAWFAAVPSRFFSGEAIDSLPFYRHYLNHIPYSDFFAAVVSFVGGSAFVWKKSGKEDGLILALVNGSLFVALIVVWFFVYFFFLREPPCG